MERLNERRMSHTPVRIAKLGAGGVRVQQFITVNVSSFGDYLRCRTWDGTTEGAELIAVARPFLLRRTPFHGFIVDGFAYTYSTPNRRTKQREDSTENETQVIVPGYVNNDTSGIRPIIYAIRGISGGTGVVESGNEEDPTKPVEWLDLNVDGRAWAKVAS